MTLAMDKAQTINNKIQQGETTMRDDMEMAWQIEEEYMEMDERASRRRMYNRKFNAKDER